SGEERKVIGQQLRRTPIEHGAGQDAKGGRIHLEAHVDFIIPINSNL
ncbi:unnamed protein product, partial [marine sediment metagenome]